MQALKHILLLLLIAIMWNCEKSEEYSAVPEIKYSAITINANTDRDTINNVQISFNLIDGDANFGYEGPIDTSTGAPEHTFCNVVFRLQAKIDTEFISLKKYIDSLLIEITDISNLYVGFNDTTTFVRIDNNQKLTRTGQYKIIKAKIDYKIPCKDIPANVDSFRYQFYVYDRAANKSNIEYTETFYSPVKPPKQMWLP